MNNEGALAKGVNYLKHVVADLSKRSLPLLFSAALIVSPFLPDGGKGVNPVCGPADLTGPRASLPGGRYTDTPRFGVKCAPNLFIE